MDQEIERQVQDLLQEVREKGDDALKSLTLRFDGVEIGPEEFRIPPERCKRALEDLPPSLRDALFQAAQRIRFYHRRTKPGDHFFIGGEGELLGEKWVPLDSVGIYAPGGRACYPSTVLMTVIPAQEAGVKRIAVATPPGKGGPAKAVLAACALLGVQEVYQIGGVQAIGAFAFGTQKIPKVDKIVGPGNLYVTAAKKLLFGTVGIDLLAGPSEVVVVADESPSPEEVARELLAQAEHDPQARVFCFVVEKGRIEEIRKALSRMTYGLPPFCSSVLEKQGAFRLFPTLEKAMEEVNRVAPEHLSLKVKNPFAALRLVRHAGAVFLGSSTPVAIGDYFAGPSHVLPTEGTARFSSGLGTRDFMKAVHVLMTPPEYLRRWGKTVSILARAEGLEAHARSVLFQEGGKGGAVE